MTKMKLTEQDRIAIRSLIDRVQITTPEELRAMLTMTRAEAQAMARQTSVLLSSGHVAAYDVIKEHGNLSEHLSVSLQGQYAPSEADVMIIAAAFALGDRASWSLHMAPTPPLMRAFHIFRVVKMSS